MNIKTNNDNLLSIFYMYSKGSDGVNAEINAWVNTTNPANREISITLTQRKPLSKAVGSCNAHL